MEARERPLLAPTGTFHRIVYAVLALLAPRMLIQLAYLERVDFSWGVLCLWWLVTFLYTIDWAIHTYRTWPAKKGSA